MTLSEIGKNLKFEFYEDVERFLDELADTRSICVIVIREKEYLVYVQKVVKEEVDDDVEY